MSGFMPNPIPEGVMGPSLIDRRFSRGSMRLAAFFLFAFFVLSTAHAQMSTGQNGTRVPQNPEVQQTSEMGIPATVGPNGNFQARRIRELNVERQKEMVSDTDDLLKLTAQLNEEVAKDHASTLTSNQMRLLARIEKLAKSVRDKMTNPVQGSIFEDNFPPQMASPTMR